MLNRLWVRNHSQTEHHNSGILRSDRGSKLTILRRNDENLTGYGGRKRRQEGEERIDHDNLIHARISYDQAVVVQMTSHMIVVKSYQCRQTPIPPEAQMSIL